LKNELESTSDSLDETQKRLKSVKLERDSLQEDFEGAGKKIDQLKRKIELQEDDLKKIEHEKENLLENKREMREKMDAMEDERRTLHETIQQLKVIENCLSLLSSVFLGQYSSVCPRASSSAKRARRKTQF